MTTSPPQDMDAARVVPGTEPVTEVTVHVHMVYGAGLPDPLDTVVLLHLMFMVAGGMALAMPKRLTGVLITVVIGAGHVTVGLQLGNMPVHAWSSPSHCGAAGSTSPLQLPHCVPPPARATQLCEPARQVPTPAVPAGPV